MITEALTKKIVAIRNPQSLAVVAICGAADLGKSFLSKKISNLLKRRNLTTNHLTLDSYLINRATRKEKGLSGYHIEAYKLNDALKDFISLKNGMPIDFAPYDHSEGKTSADSFQMNPSDILILDGLHAMHDSFLPFINLSIFIDTADTDLKNIRTEADLTKRKYSLAYSQSISESEFKLYKSKIEPYKKSADYILRLKDKWNYQLV